MKSIDRDIWKSRVKNSWNQLDGLYEAVNIFRMFSRAEILEIVAAWRAQGVDMKRMPDEPA